MDKDLGICGRDKEIKAINEFVIDHVEGRKSGILYLTGPPGTGKTMSINHVLDRLDTQVPTLRLNCYKARSATKILKEICEFLDLKKCVKMNEPEMIAQIAKKFSGRTCKPYLILLDEMDELPKSKNFNLFRTVFSWTRLDFSKLIIIGIANTLNLTARCQTISTYVGEGYSQIDKIIFKPYTSLDLKSILNWYLENDEDFEDVNIDPKVIQIIASRYGKENGDIRKAMSALRSALDDTAAEKNEALKTTTKEKEQVQPGDLSHYPTPPSTPPPPTTPCKERQTNLNTVIKSAKKRQRESHYHEDKAATSDQIVLVALFRMCTKSADGCVDKVKFYGKIADILQKYGSYSVGYAFNSALEQLEAQGLITIKKKRSQMSSDKVVLKASQQEIERLVPNMSTIMQLVGYLK